MNQYSKETPKQKTDRFFSRKTIKKNTGCWEFTGWVNPNTGYGQVKLGNKKTSAHRAALILSTKIDPNDKDACHHCDNRKCINPKHLWWGSRSENVKDMLKKGRAPKHFFSTENSSGERHPKAKLKNTK